VETGRLYGPPFEKFSNILVLSLALLSSACAQSSSYREEFAGMGVDSVGRTNTAYMSNEDLSKAIDRAYLEGELTAEQARKAHIQLDVKGHLTAKQIAVINRDRLAPRHEYESKKEDLDVYRDITSTGSSIIGDVRDIKNTINSIFR
jgi:hypothetical protein